MLKKGGKLDWTTKALDDAFVDIKRAIKEAPVLKSPKFSKPSQIFSFASFHIIVVVMLQNNDEGNEEPIAFFSKSLHDVELKYDINEKQSDALVKIVKYLRPYLVGAKIVAYVPNVVVKDIFRQTKVTGRRCRWIQITNLVKGQGLAKLRTKSNLDATQVNKVIGEDAIVSIESPLVQGYCVFLEAYEMSKRNEG